MKQSLTKKLFCITLLSFVILLFGVKIIQASFFQSFYYEKKMDHLENELKKFTLLYSGARTNTLTSGMVDFEKSNNTKLGILSNDGKLLYISNAQNMTYTEALFNDIYGELQDKIEKMRATGKYSSLLLNSKVKDETYIVSVSPISVSLPDDSICIAISSIQFIQEANSVLNDFYLYILGVAAVISIIVAIIYSIIIANPLKALNRIAAKMASLDFSQKCIVDRDDEIGGLATSLNTLSTNLNNALEDLKVKNLKLKNDIDKERNLEKMRKDFVAGVSHELKTPIGIIQGYAEGIKDGLDENRTNDYLDIIIDEANKMNKLVLNMLELSKLESGSLTPTKENFNVIRCIRKVLRKLEKDIESHNLNLIYNNEYDYIYIDADPFQVEQILENFITNAIKYTPENNDVIITISKTDTNFYFSIENKGAHISEEKLNQIWNYFYRADESRRRKDGSTGLGLAIVKNILDLHQSEYGAQNTEDGVIFYFNIKLSDEENI